MKRQDIRDQAELITMMGPVQKKCSMAFTLKKYVSHAFRFQNVTVPWIYSVHLQIRIFFLSNIVYM